MFVSGITRRAAIAAEGQVDCDSCYTFNFHESSKTGFGKSADRRDMLTNDLIQIEAMGLPVYLMLWVHTSILHT